MRIIKNLIKVATAVCIMAAPLFTAQTASAEDLKSWQKSVGKLIAKKQTYPRAAMRKEIEGKAKVKVSIDRTGAITGFEMTQSTGNDILDNAVPKLMERLNPLPTPPASLSETQLSFVLPLTWRIQ